MFDILHAIYTPNQQLSINGGIGFRVKERENNVHQKRQNKASIAVAILKYKKQ